MENKPPLFIFPKLDQKNIYLFIFVMCSLLRRVIPYLIEVTGFGAIKKVNFNKSCLFDMLSNFTADFLPIHIGSASSLNPVTWFFSLSES